MMDAGDLCQSCGYWVATIGSQCESCFDGVPSLGREAKVVAAAIVWRRRQPPATFCAAPWDAGLLDAVDDLLSNEQA
jgi:hypothetical protein